MYSKINLTADDGSAKQSFNNILNLLLYDTVKNSRNSKLYLQVR